MAYEDFYYAARSRYSDACSEIRSCENRSGDLKRQKSAKISEINDLKSELKKNEKALKKIEAAIKTQSV